MGCGMSDCFESINLLIFNYSKDLEKPAYCAERNIDVVTPEWLYTSLKTLVVQATYPFMLPNQVCDAIQQIITARRRTEKMARAESAGDSNK